MDAAVYGLTSDFVFRAAAEFLSSKEAVPMEVYEQLQKRARDRAFSVSRYTSAEVLNQFLRELVDAIEDGTTGTEFRKRMNDFLERNGYTEMAGLTAKATKANIATMTDLFATGYGIYKGFYTDLSDMEFAELFSAGISTSVKQFKTNGNEMAAAIQSLGASATNAQVPLEEQLSILGMLQATMSGSEAGTKYNAFLRSAAKGGEALGMSFVDANNQLLSMPEILDMLHGKFGDTLDAAEKMELQKAFGDSETIKLIDLMYGKVGELENNIVSMYGSLGQGTAATLEMAEAINSSDPAKFEIMRQKLHNIGETISNAVTPNVMEYMDKISGVVDKAGEWVSSHSGVVNVIFAILAGLAGFLMISGTVTTVMHPRGQGSVDIIITSTAGEAGEELLQKVAEAVEEIRGEYDNLLIKSAVTVYQDLDVLIELPELISSDGVEDRTRYAVENYFKVSTSRKLNELVLLDLYIGIKQEVPVLKNIKIRKPEGDIKLAKGNVILLGQLNVTVIWEGEDV